MGKDRAAASMLDAFCLANNIATPRLAEAAKVSRQHITRVRFARTDVRIRIAKKIALGASSIVGRKVSVAELFDVDFDFPRKLSKEPR
jgi:hypothetical protein